MVKWRGRERSTNVIDRTKDPYAGMTLGQIIEYTDYMLRKDQLEAGTGVSADSVETAPAPIPADPSLRPAGPQAPQPMPRHRRYRTQNVGK